MPGRTIGWPSMWAGIGQAEEGEDRRRGVGQVGLEVTAGRQVGAGQRDDAFGPVRAGEVRVGLDPGRAGGQLGAHPVGFIGQGDQVGITFAGRVDLVGLGRGDDLGEERLAGLGMPGLGQGIGGGRCGPRRSGGGSSSGRRSSRPRAARRS